jgi:lipoprotein NlpI
MRVAVEQAIRLEPLLAEAHNALGMLYARDARWVESEKSFRRAIEIDPNSSASHMAFAYILNCVSRGEEALDQLTSVPVGHGSPPDDLHTYLREFRRRGGARGYKTLRIMLVPGSDNRNGQSFWPENAR